MPEPFIRGGTAARIMSLRDGTAKMSKSDPSDMSRINLTDSDDEITQKIRKAKTDPEPLPDDAARWRAARGEQPGGIYGALAGQTVDEVLARFAGQGFGAFKPALADALVALIAPIRQRLDDLRREPASSTESSRRAQHGRRTRCAGPRPRQGRGRPRR